MHRNMELLNKMDIIPPSTNKADVETVDVIEKYIVQNIPKIIDDTIEILNLVALGAKSASKFLSIEKTNIAEDLHPATKILQSYLIGINNAVANLEGNGKILIDHLGDKYQPKKIIQRNPLSGPVLVKNLLLLRNKFKKLKDKYTK